MRHPLIQAVLELFLSALIAIGLFSSAAHAASIRLDVELETKDQKDSGSTLLSKTGEISVIQMKNGVLRVAPVDLTDKTIRLKAQLFASPDTALRPLYNSTFLTNLNMDAEIREMRQDGSLLYKLKVTPHVQIEQASK